MIPLIWAAVFAIANWPLYRRCAQHVPEAMRAHVLPLAFSILITFLVLGPIVFAFAILARQSQAWLTEISIMDKGGLLAPSWLRATPMVGTRLADAWNDAAGAPGGLSALLSRVEDSSLLRSLQWERSADCRPLVCSGLIGPMLVAVGKAMLDQWLTHVRPRRGRQAPQMKSASSPSSSLTNSSSAGSGSPVRASRSSSAPLGLSLLP
jgi:predicted PurR-regulated permease PerM